MAHYNQRHNSLLENLWLDVVDEDRCVWKNREQLETYYLLCCCTVFLIPWKLPSYLKSRGRTDHRGQRWLKGEKPT